MRALAESASSWIVGRSEIADLRQFTTNRDYAQNPPARGYKRYRPVTLFASTTQVFATLQVAMTSHLFVALSVLTAVVGFALPLRSQSNEPVLQVGNGITAPQPLNQPDPEYSEEARKADLQGTCVLSLIVNSEGKPENIKVSRRLGRGLDEKALEAVSNWTFEPARKDGKPVAVLINVAVTFRLGNGALSTNAREALEKGQEATAEFRRNAWKRVYRIDGATSGQLCDSARKQEEATQSSFYGLKTDGRQYRLASISFTNNKAITNADALRGLFPIKDGEPFDSGKVADGLRQLRTVYRTQGFVSFKSSVEPLLDESQRTIALQIKCDEGRQFFVDHINIEGLDELTFQKVRTSLYVRPGDIYNERLANLWLEKNLRLTTPDVPLNERITLNVNENVGTVVMTYDLSRCAK